MSSKSATELRCQDADCAAVLDVSAIPVEYVGALCGCGNRPRTSTCNTGMYAPTHFHAQPFCKRYFGARQKARLFHLRIAESRQMLQSAVRQ